MNWLHLIEAANLLAGLTGGPAPRGRPRQAMLKRAISTAYYAMFHALCQTNANALIGISPGPPYPMAWTRAYRVLDHNFARERLVQHHSRASEAIQAFALSFSDLQQQRHRADYDPNARFLRSEVGILIERTETAVQELLAATDAERRALAAIVLLRDR